MRFANPEFCFAGHILAQEKQENTTLMLLKQ